MDRQQRLAWGAHSFRQLLLPNRLFVALLLMATVSCTHLPTGVAVTTKMMADSMPSHWQVNGKLSLQIPHHTELNRPQTYVLRFNWEQAEDDYTLNLLGPLNIGLLRIIKKQQLTTLIQGQRRVTSTNAEQLLLEQTNLPLPLNSLQFWLMGQPSPMWPVQKDNSATDQAGFTQQGWHIHYSAFISDESHALPKKIVASHASLKLKIAIHQWQFNRPNEQQQ